MRFLPHNPFQNLSNCPAGWQSRSWGITLQNCQLITTQQSAYQDSNILVLINMKYFLVIWQKFSIYCIQALTQRLRRKLDLSRGSNLSIVTGQNLNTSLDLWNEIGVAVPQQSSEPGAPAAKEALWSGEQASAYDNRDSGSILHPTTDFQRASGKSLRLLCCCPLSVCLAVWSRSLLGQGLFRFASFLEGYCNTNSTGLGQECLQTA